MTPPTSDIEVLDLALGRLRDVALRQIQSRQDHISASIHVGTDGSFTVLIDRPDGQGRRKEHFRTAGA
jgi:hypothetical protein